MRPPRPWMIAPLCAVACALLPGCASETHEQVVELEANVQSLRQRLDGLSGDRDALAARVKALEALRAQPARARRAKEERLALLEARVLELEGRVQALENVRDGTRSRPGRTIGGGTDPMAGVVTIPTPGRQVAPLAQPAGPVDVLTVGSGSLLLVRLPGGRLERVELLGLEAPRRAEAYARDPRARIRDEEALGRKLSTDAAWDLSRRHLAGLLTGKEVHLAFPDGGPRRSEAGALQAYVEVHAAGKVEDVNLAMVRDGFALATPGEHPRSVAYRAAEAEAKKARRGLFK